MRRSRCDNTSPLFRRIDHSKEAPGSRTSGPGPSSGENTRMTAKLRSVSFYDFTPRVCVSRGRSGPNNHVPMLRTL
jgi:hypothetical protein